jgi:ribosome modulation factor
MKYGMLHPTRTIYEEEGWDAFAAGKAKDMCPYPVTCKQAAEWNVGWTLAEGKEPVKRTYLRSRAYRRAPGTVPHSKWALRPEKASGGKRICIVLHGARGDTVVATTPAAGETDAYFADYILQALEAFEKRNL